MAILKLAAALLLRAATAQNNMPGHCPEVKKGWDESEQGKLDLERLAGQWLNVYDAEENTMEFECMAIKLVPGVDPNNSTKVELWQGSLSPASHDPALLDRPKRFVIYDPNLVLTFNNPKDSSQAALHHKHKGEANLHEYLAEYDPDPLSDEDKAELTVDEILHHEEEEQAKAEMRLRLEQVLGTFDPYKNGMRVLDTDYTSYLILFHCNQQWMDEHGHFDKQAFHIELRASQKMRAQQMKSQLQSNSIFQQLQDRIDRLSDSTILKSEQLQDEIMTLLTLYPKFEEHFSEFQPNVEEWREIRQFYGRAEVHLDDDEVKAEIKREHFSLQLSIFVRETGDLTNDRFAELVAMTQEMVPSFDLDSTHKRLFHNKAVCPSGDIFESEGAMSYDDAIGRSNEQEKEKLREDLDLTDLLEMSELGQVKDEL